MNRFFVKQEDIRNDIATITGEDVAHIARVLRMSAGDTLMVCDGACTEYEGAILSIGKTVEVALGEGKRCLAELPYRITLLQGLPKAGKMETIIQKCVELGVYAIQPVMAARSVARMTEKEFEKKRVRYVKVAVEAAKQSRRGILPRFTDFCRLIKSIMLPTICFLCWTRRKTRVRCTILCSACRAV